MRVSSRTSVLTVAIVSVLLGACAAQTPALRRSRSSKRHGSGSSDGGRAVLPAGREAVLEARSDIPLLVSLLDGTLVALDQDSGDLLWSFDTGSPLVSASGHSGGGTVGSASQPSAIFPGADGSLYVYRHKSADERGLEKLPLSVAEVVDIAPSVTPDGNLLVGSRTTTVYLLDPATGAVLRAFHEFGGGLAEIDNILGSGVDMGGVKPIPVGRHDYTVRGLDPESGTERWNVTYAQLSRLAPLPAPGLPTPEANPETAGLGISAGLRNTLRRRNPGTGEHLWARAFAAPPVAAHAAGGESVPLYQAAPQGSGWLGGFMCQASGGNTLQQQGLQSTWGQMLPGGAVAGEEDAVLVGSIRGSLYALPASGFTAPGEDLLDDPDGSLGLDDGLVIPPMASDGLVPVGGKDGAAGVGERSCPLGLHPVADAREGLHDMLPLVPGNGSDSEEGMRHIQRLKLIVLERMVRDLNVFEGWTWWGTLFAWFIAGGGCMGLVILLVWSRKKQVVTDIDGNEETGMTKLTVGFTGTVEEAAEMAEDSRKTVKERVGQGTIRDYTGSGVEHVPDENCPPSQAKGRRKGKVRHPRYSNRLNGVLQQASHANGVSKPVEEDPGRDGEDCNGPVPDHQPYNSVESGSNGDDSSRGSGPQRRSAREPGSREGATRVGRMEMGPEILGYGSGGTLVFEGELDGRPVAVKRILHQFYDLARKEIGALILSDEHPNVVRCFAMEEDAEFVYLALERCRHSLNDLMASPEGAAQFVDAQHRPSDFCMQVAEEAGAGLAALHERGIIHRDLKPHNVLLTENSHAKLSDMGLCKRLTTEETSFESPGAGGSSGWQAPEQLICRSGGGARQGRSVDIFSFGLLIFYCLTGGRHAFGESYERDFNILQGRANLRAIAHLAEADNLVRAMLAPQPKRRPGMAAVMAHPFWWRPAHALAFLIALSDRMENEDREEDQSLLRALEECGEEALGGPSWAARLDEEFLANLGRYRKYQHGSLRDLLRVIRNKHNHFREMPPSLQLRLGPVPDGFLGYFTERFPRLVLTCWCFARAHCDKEPGLARFLPSAAAAAFPFSTDSLKRRLAAGMRAGAAPAPRQRLDEVQGRSRSAPVLTPIVEAPREEVAARSASAPVGDELPVPLPLGCEPIAHNLGCEPSGNWMPQGRARPRTSRSSGSTTTSSTSSAFRAAGLRTDSPARASPLKPLSPAPSPGPLDIRVADDLALARPRGPPASPEPRAGADAARSPAPPPHAVRVLRGGSGTPYSPDTGAPDGGVQGEAAPSQSVTFTVDMEDAPGAALLPGDKPGSTGQTADDATGSATSRDSTSSERTSEGSDASSDGRGRRLGGPKPHRGNLGRERGGGGRPLRGGGGEAAASPHDGDDVDSLDSYMLLGRSLGAELGFLSAEDAQRWEAQGPAPQRATAPPSLPAAPWARPPTSHALHSPLGPSQPAPPPAHMPPALPPLLRAGPGKPISPTAAPAPTGASIPVFPQRLGQALCDFYMKTGHCKFGEGCKFDHPLRFAVALNRAGLPLRPSEAVCGYFERTGECKFGPACKFHHPDYAPDHAFPDAPQGGPGPLALGALGGSVSQQLSLQPRPAQQPRQRRGGRRISES